IFKIVADLFDLLVFEDRLDFLEDALAVEDLATVGAAHGNVITFGRFPGKTHADELALHGPERIGLGVKSKTRLLFQFIDEVREFFLGVDQYVLAIRTGDRTDLLDVLASESLVSVS